jgi:hypothetical protein
MSTRLQLDEEHALLKNELCQSLRKKRALELKINEQFEKLKRLEMSLEKMEWTLYEPKNQYADSGHRRNSEIITTLH